jgi:hypothetical protein
MCLLALKCGWAKRRNQPVHQGGGSPRASRKRRVFAYLTHGPVVSRILKHLKLPDTPPPLAPARGPPQDAFWY